MTKKSETIFKPEGKVREFKPHSEIDTGVLDWFECEPGLEWGTRFEEFQSVCPGSGQPDQAILKIQIKTNSRIVEMKSLKYYLQSFRDVGIFQEHVTQRIFDDILKTIKPADLYVELNYWNRGGFSTKCSKEGSILPFEA